ncbi:uncharacterized protein LOC119604874 [Lucilia sericata]|uniref:uncharacterized protein LOC119604874 n=1 Tax=Lucilia sericata TaxID=13632 RepID=UPI0018A82ACB|nr:uncharacterized protein LOC119604874 [Lucilia sericata]
MMKFQIIYLTIISNIYFVKSDEILTNEFTLLQNKLFADVLDTKERLEHLKESVDILNKRHLQQINGLKDVVATCHKTDTGIEPLLNSEDMCEEIIFYSNETLSKYAQFNDKLLIKLADSHRNQSQHLDAILNHRNVENECQLENPQLIATSTENFLTEIDIKINKFEEQLSQFEFLEEKLTLQQKKFAEFNENQMKLLTKIKDKLLKNEEQFVKYQRELPDINNFSNKINNLANWRHWGHRHIPRQ